MNEQYVFISLITKLYTDKIIAGFVRLGYAVAPVAGAGYIVANNDSPVALLSLKISSILENAPLRDKIIEFLNQNNINYYSVLVIAGNPGMAWAGSNISIKKLNAAKAKKNVSYLKLVDKPSPEQEDK